MKRIIFTALILLGVVAPSTYAQISKKKVAVYMTGEIEQSYKKVIGAKLVSAITTTDEYAAVERTADFLAALASEQDYQTSGAVKDSQIARIGQQFGVRYVVVADVNELFDEIFIAARLINVESGLVEKAADASAVAESMTQLVELSTQISDKLLCGSDVSKNPIHLSLCATKDGKIFYFTQEKWEKMNDATKPFYKKQGICLIHNGEIKIFKGQKYGRPREINSKSTAANYNWANYILDIKTHLIELLIKFQISDVYLFDRTERVVYSGQTLWLYEDGDVKYTYTNHDTELSSFREERPYFLVYNITDIIP